MPKSRASGWLSITKEIIPWPSSKSGLVVSFVARAKRNWLLVERFEFKEGKILRLYKGLATASQPRRALKSRFKRSGKSIDEYHKGSRRTWWKMSVVGRVYHHVISFSHLDKDFPFFSMEHTYLMFVSSLPDGTNSIHGFATQYKLGKTKW